MGFVRNGLCAGRIPALVCLLLFAAACGSLLKPLPAFNLQETGWTVREGQAVWQPEQSAAELTGDVLLATHPDGRSFIQFSKGLPMVHGQRQGGQWQVNFPAENREYSGRGNPPKRIIWLHVPHLVQGGEPPSGWSIVRQEQNELEVYHPERGERLRVVFP